MLPALPLTLLALSGSAEARDPCAGRSAEGCAARAQVLFDETLVACLRGTTSACAGAGTIQRFQPDPDPAEAARLFARACELGDPHGCARSPAHEAPLRPDYALELAVLVGAEGITVRPVDGASEPAEAVHLACLSGGLCTGPRDYDLFALSEVIRTRLLAAGPGEPRVHLTLRRDLPASFSLSVADAVQRHPDGDLLVPGVIYAGGTE